MAARALPAHSHRVLSVVGTRPEGIKMAPVIRALAALPSIEQRLLLTGQHRGLAGMFDMLPASAIRELALDLRDQSVGELQALIREAICGSIAAAPPDLVIVQGDTISALAGALAARDCGVPIAHVEAGLRSYNRAEPWPEEDNRVAIDALSDLLFAPSETAAAHLAAEPQVAGAVHVTGNTGIDALFRACEGRPSAPTNAERKTILVTCHRRENQGAALERICTALRRLVDEMPLEILFLLHPNRHNRAAARAMLAGNPNIALLEPVSHEQMVRLMQRCWLILTDSGGLQEEGPALGRPVLVMRNVTERIEAPANVELVGTEPTAILAAVHRLMMDEVRYARMARPAFPFGDGHAAPRIAMLIEDWLSARARLAL